MEIALSDDQEFFRDTTRKFLGSECPIPKVRELRSNPDGFERDYWRQGAELGWTSLLVPEDLGGGSVSGNGAADLALVADAFGTHVAPGPLLACNVVAATLSRSGSTEQQGEIVPAIVAGDVVATWAFTEAPPHDGLGDIALRAEADGSDYVLTGVKSPVEAGAQADQLLVTATTDAGAAQFLLAPDTPGITVTPLRSVDLVRRYARIQFDGARVPASALVGEAGAADGRRRAPAAARRGRAECGDGGCGPGRSFDLTLDWAFSRYSFGRPLASYQEIKHRFADMKMWLEASHALADGAARHVRRERRGRTDGQHGQGVHRRLPRRARPGLRAAARWHRRHLRPRHPPVPPADHRRPASRTARRPITAAASAPCARAGRLTRRARLAR